METVWVIMIIFYVLVGLGVGIFLLIRYLVRNREVEREGFLGEEKVEVGDDIPDIVINFRDDKGLEGHSEFNLYAGDRRQVGNGYQLRLYPRDLPGVSSVNVFVEKNCFHDFGKGWSKYRNMCVLLPSSSAQMIGGLSGSGLGSFVEQFVGRINALQLSLDSQVELYETAVRLLNELVSDPTSELAMSRSKAFIDLAQREETTVKTELKK